jgi:chemotaxis protein MotB
VASKSGKDKGHDHDAHELIIIRRLEEEEHEAHNSAWKVAHADFMTAMMAFFLIMWLINATDEETRKGISAYFNPLHLSAAEKGLNGGDPAPTGNTAKGAQDAAGEKKPAPDKGDETSAASEHPAQKAASIKGGDGPAGGGKAAALAAGRSGKDVVGFDKPGGGLTKLAHAAGKVNESDSREEVAFRDPYGVLAELAAEYKATRPAGGDALGGDDRLAGLAGGAATRDPFDPIYWPAAPDKPQPGAGKTPHPPSGGEDTAAAPAPVEPPAPPPSLRQTAAPPPLAAEPAPAKIADTPTPNPAPDKPSRADSEAAARRAAQELNTEVRLALGPDLADSPAPSVKVEATRDGILISLTDGTDFSMFDIGSAIPNGKVVFIVGRIAEMLAKRAGPIVVRGFTDARPFHSDIYDNWRLSAERAHMAYYMLMRGGLEEKRVSRIEGLADRSLKNVKDPNAAENRRIEILLEWPKT